MKYKLYTQLILTGLLLINPVLHSKAKTTTIELTLDKAVEMSLDFAHSIQKSEQITDQSRWLVREARSSALPSIQVEGRWQYNADIPSFGGFSLTNKYEYASTVQLNQALYTFGTISTAIETANRTIELSLIQQDVARHEIAHEVHQAYFTAVLAKKQYEIAKDSLKNSKTNFAIFQEITRRGRAPQQDLIRLQADIASRRPQVEQAKSQYEQALINLKKLTGLIEHERTSIKLLTSFSNANQLPSYDRSQLYQKLHQDEPQLRSLGKNIKLQDSIAKANRISNRPRLSAFANKTFSATDNDTLFGSQQKLNSTAFGLALTWDIWDGGAKNARYEQALVDRNIAILTKDQTKNQMQAVLGQTIQNYESLKRVLPMTKESVELAENSFRLSQNRFRSGETTVTELNDAESLLTQAKVQKAMIYFEIHQSNATIKRLTSQLNKQ